MPSAPEPNLTFLELPSGDFIFYAQDGWKTYYVDKKPLVRGGVCSNIEGLTTRKVINHFTLDKQRITREAFEEHISSFKKTLEDGSVEWCYPGASEAFAVFYARVGDEVEELWDPVPSDRIKIIKIPINFDPAFEFPLWHQDFSRASLLQFDQCTYAKVKAAKVFEGLLVEVPEHSGIEYMKVDGNYIGKERFEGTYIGTSEDIRHRKADIDAYLHKCYLKLESKKLTAAVFSAESILSALASIYTELNEVVAKRDSALKLSRAKNWIKNLENKLYTTLETKIGGKDAR